VRSASARAGADPRRQAERRVEVCPARRRARARRGRDLGRGRHHGHRGNPDRRLRAAALPAHLAASRRLDDGTAIVIRPIHPEDDAIERAFISGLSSDTRYNRLLGARKLTPERFGAYAHRLRTGNGFVAVTGQGAQLRLLGVARYVRDADAAAEFGVVVADAWQRKGLAPCC